MNESDLAHEIARAYGRTVPGGPWVVKHRPADPNDAWPTREWYVVSLSRHDPASPFGYAVVCECPDKATAEFVVNLVTVIDADLAGRPRAHNGVLGEIDKARDVKVATR